MYENVGGTDMNNRVYGYIRVSTREQNIERQLISLVKAGVKRENIYIDKQSGKNFERPAYVKMMHKIREGDLFRTCPFWTPRRRKICWGRLSATLSYSSFPLSLKMSAIISASARQKGSRRQRPEGSGLENP